MSTSRILYGVNYDPLLCVLWTTRGCSERDTFVAVISATQRSPAAGHYQHPCWWAFSHYGMEAMEKIIQEQVKRVQAMTDNQKERFLKIYFHQKVVRSEREACAASSLPYTMEWKR